MATTDYLSLEGELRCTVCLGQYKNPKILSCHHSFCLECIERLPVLKERIDCPECRRPTQLPNNSAKLLQNSFVIHQLLEMSNRIKRHSGSVFPQADSTREQLVCSECKYEYRDPRTLNCGHSFCMECIERLHNVNNYPVVCPKCHHKTKLPGETARNLPVDASIEMLLDLQSRVDHPTPEKCPKHKDQELQAYCTACQQVACWKCVYEIHKKHDIIDIEDCYPENEREINSELNKVEEKISQLIGMIKKISDSREDVKRAKEDVENEIHKKAQEVVERVRLEERCLLEELDRIAGHKMGVLDKLKEDAQCKVDRLHISKMIVKLTMSKSSKQAIIRNKPKLLEHTKLAEGHRFDPKLFQPKTTGNFAFCSKRVELAFGYITIKPKGCFQNVSMPYGISKCDNGSFVVVQKQDNDTIMLCDSGGRRVTVIDKLGKKKLDLPKTPCAVAATPDGQHTWVCNQGKVQKIQLEGGRLLRGEGSDNIKGAQGIAVSSKTGSAFALDSAGRNIFVLPGNIMQRLQQPIQSPKGIAIDKEGILYILDRDSIKKFTQQGDFLGHFGSTLGTSGSHISQLIDASSITIDEYGVLYATMETGHKISVFDREGNFLCCFGQEGSGEGEFLRPNGITVDGQGHFYICDTYNNRIVVYNIV